MTKASATLIAVYRPDNLNKPAAFLADNSPEGARVVVPALAANRIEWSSRLPRLCKSRNSLNRCWPCWRTLRGGSPRAMPFLRTGSAACVSASVATIT